MNKLCVSDGQGANIAPIPDIHKLLDPVFLEAHQLIDRVPRHELARMIPLLKRAAQGNPTSSIVLNPVDKNILPSAARMELPEASSLAGPGGRPRMPLP